MTTKLPPHVTRYYQLGKTAQAQGQLDEAFHNFFQHLTEIARFAQDHDEDFYRYDIPEAFLEVRRALDSVYYTHEFQATNTFPPAHLENMRNAYQTISMDYVDIPLYTLLSQVYPFFTDPRWRWTYNDSHPEVIYQAACDNFPVQHGDLTLFLEAVFYVIPATHQFLIEAYTTLFEIFPDPENPEDPLTLPEVEFLQKLHTNPEYVAEILSTYAPNHPITKISPREIEVLYFLWQDTRKKYGGGDGSIVFPLVIRREIIHQVQSLLACTSWHVQMLEEYEGYV